MNLLRKFRFYNYLATLFSELLAWFHGLPCTITNGLSRVANDYNIYGNSIQDGTPTISTPIEIASVGDKTENIAYLDQSVNTDHSYFTYTSETNSSVIGVHSQSGSKFLAAFKCQIESGKTYKINYVTSGVNLWYYYKDRTWGTTAGITVSNAQFTAPYTGTLVCAAYVSPNVTATVSNFRIVEGTTLPQTYEPYGYRIPVVATQGENSVTTNIYLDQPLRKCDTSIDKINFLDTKRYNNCKEVTLSAGTHTLSDAKSNGKFYCSQQASGTLSGTTLTLDTGVTNAQVIYELATQTEEIVTLPSLTPSIGTTTYTIGTEVQPFVSVNLFDVTLISTGKFIRAKSSTTYSLGSEGSASGWSCSAYTKVEASTTYTVTYPLYVSASPAGLVYFSGTSVDSAISGVTMTQQGGTVYTFTTPATCNYVRFSWSNTQGNKCQLEEGSIATAYEPYCNGMEVQAWVTEQTSTPASIDTNGVVTATGSVASTGVTTLNGTIDSNGIVTI